MSSVWWFDVDVSELVLERMTPAGLVVLSDLLALLQELLVLEQLFEKTEDFAPGTSPNCGRCLGQDHDGRPCAVGAVLRR